MRLRIEQALNGHLRKAAVSSACWTLCLLHLWPKRTAPYTHAYPPRPSRVRSPYAWANGSVEQRVGQAVGYGRVTTPW